MKFLYKMRDMPDTTDKGGYLLGLNSAGTAFEWTNTPVFDVETIGTTYRGATRAGIDAAITAGAKSVELTGNITLASAWDLSAYTGRFSTNGHQIAGAFTFTAPPDFVGSDNCFGSTLTVAGLPDVQLTWFGSTDAALVAVKDFAGTVFVNTPVTLTADITTTCGLYINRGCPITLGDYDLTEAGPHLSDGKYTQYVQEGTGVVTSPSTGPHGKECRPEWWMVGTEPHGEDMTEPIHKAAACAAAGRGTVVLSSRYRISSKILFKNAYFYTVRSENATLNGGSTTEQTALVEVDNAYRFHMTGTLYLENNAATNSNYPCGLRVKTTDESVPWSAHGGLTRVSFKDLHIHQFKEAIYIGTKNDDTINSETIFENINFSACPGLVHIAGSQTFTSFVNCNLVSTAFAAAGTDYFIVKSEGGGISFLSGEVVCSNAGNTHYAIQMYPSVSATYGNPYGQIRFTGVHLETASSLFAKIDDPDSVGADVGSGLLSVVNCVGYCGASVSSTFISVIDTSFAGQIIFSKCNLYTGSAGARSAWTINTGTSAAKVDVDALSFGTGFLGWFEGITGSAGTVYGPGTVYTRTHSYGAGTTAWTLTPSEANARKFATTSAGGAVDAILPSTFSGVFFVNNSSGQTVTWKYAASTGVANATAKKAIMIADGAEVYSIKADY